MLETESKEILDENTFMIHFIDKSLDGINPEQSNEIRRYETDDDAEFQMGLRVNAMPLKVLIDLKIKYPKNFYSPNFYAIISTNEKRFQNFYNEIMNYNETTDYNGLIDIKKTSKIKG